MADDVDSGNGADDDGFEALPATPDYLVGHESVWDMAISAQISGASEQDVQDLADWNYYGYVDRTVSPDDRHAYRMEADAMREEFGVDIDWDRWRAEMGEDYQ